jgi:hypothetical protein
VPVLALLGILEAGRRLSAPLSIAGDWTLQFDPAAPCADTLASLGQPGLTISQSGAAALITLNDGHTPALDATIQGATLAAGSLTAAISGEPAERTLAGTMNFDGCAPVAFRAVRQLSKNRGR